MRKTQAVILDFDGLAVNTEALRFEAHRQTLFEYGKELQLEHYVPTMTELKGAEAVFGHYIRTFNLRVDLASLSGRAGELWEERYPSKVELQEGVIDVIEQTKARGLPLAIASNRGKVSVMDGLVKLGIDGMFDLVVNADELVSSDGKAVGKPDPEIYLVTAARLGIDSSGCLVFEDSEAGVLSAKGAGMKVVYVPDERFNSSFHPDADLILPSMKAFTRSHFDGLEGVVKGSRERSGGRL